MLLTTFTFLAQFGSGLEGPGQGVLDPGATKESAAASLNNTISLIIGMLTIVAGLAFLIYFFIGALNWVTSGGDQGKVDNAKKNMTHGAIGLIIIVLSYGIVALVGEILGIEILNPGQAIIKLNQP